MRNTIYLLNINPGSEEAVLIFLTFFRQIDFQNFIRCCSFILLYHLKCIFHLCHMKELLEVDMLKNLHHILT